MVNNAPTLSRMVARRVRRGSNSEDSWKLLRKLLATVSHGENLAHALVYQDFATELQAERYIAYLADQDSPDVPAE